MSKALKLFKSKEHKSRSDVVGFLKQLAEKIENGNVTLRGGSEEIRLEIPDKVVLEVEVDEEEKKAKGKEHSLEIEIKWYDKDILNDSIKIE